MLNIIMKRFITTNSTITSTNIIILVLETDSSLVFEPRWPENMFNIIMKRFTTTIITSTNKIILVLETDSYSILHPVA